MYSYRMAGLNIASELALPGARENAAVSCDVVMRRGQVPAALERATVSLPGWETDGERLLIRAAGVARFLVSRGDDVEFESEHGASAADCAAYLQGSVLAALLHQRGQIVLHASAVEVDGRAILICGRSGLGKSTLAAAINGRGYPLLGDDICAIGFDDAGAPHASGDARQSKLSDDAIVALNLDERRRTPVMRNRGKYYVEPKATGAPEATPVAAVYALRRESPGHPAGLIELDAANAMRAILRNAFRLELVKRTGQTARYFEAAVAMARRVPVSRLIRPNLLKRIPESVACIEGHWNSIGLFTGTSAC